MWVELHRTARPDARASISSARTDSSHSPVCDLARVQVQYLRRRLRQQAASNVTFVVTTSFKGAASPVTSTASKLETDPCSVGLCAALSNVDVLHIQSEPVASVAVELQLVRWAPNALLVLEGRYLENGVAVPGVPLSLTESNTNGTLGQCTLLFAGAVSTWTCATSSAAATLVVTALSTANAGSPVVKTLQLQPTGACCCSKGEAGCRFLLTQPRMLSATPLQVCRSV